MTELTPLHYLSAYLPHNIEVETPNGVRIMSDQFLNDKEIVIGAVASRGYKPLLHPLSKLTEEIEHNGERFVPIVEIYNILRPNVHFDSFTSSNKLYQCWFFDKDGSECAWIDCLINQKTGRFHSFDIIEHNKRRYQSNQFQAFQKLFEWHLDVFNLIPQGKAIEK